MAMKKKDKLSLGNTGAGNATVERHAATPGPWRVLKAAGGWIETAGNPYGRGSMHIADVRGWGHLTGQGGGCAFSEDKAIAIQDANANLIAAAPELLEAGEMLWVVLANVSGGDWSKQSVEWQEVAGRWRDNYFDVARKAQGRDQPEAAQPSNNTEEAL
jgi:hypothetical protein